MKKPKKHTIKYYDWNEVKNYLVEKKIWNESFASDVWIELCDRDSISNGKPFAITDWLLKHDNGKFDHLVCKVMKLAITDLLKHFGEPDKNCTTPGVLTATFIANW